MSEPHPSTLSRERILTRLRAHRPRPAPISPLAGGSGASVTTHADRAPSSPRGAELPVRRFDWSLEERLERLERQLTAVHGELIPVADDWPQQLAQRLTLLGARQMRYGPKGPLAAALRAGWPDAGGVAQAARSATGQTPAASAEAAAPAAASVRAPTLVPHDQPIALCREALFVDTDAGFTSCRGAIAETGSLVLWPTPAEPRLLSLVPPIHIVLLEAERVFSTLHEMMVVEDWRARMPTNALLISGPSKSADIEQTLAYGVHGPARLIVLLKR